MDAHNVYFVFIIFVIIIVIFKLYNLKIIEKFSDVVNVYINGKITLNTLSSNKLQVSNNINANQIYLNGQYMSDAIEFKNLNANNLDLFNLTINGTNINNEINSLNRELDILDRTKYKNFNNIKNDRAYPFFRSGSCGGCLGGRWENACIKEFKLNVPDLNECKNICMNQKNNDDVFIYEYYKDKRCICRNCRNPMKPEGDVDSNIVESGVIEYKDVQNSPAPIENINECFDNVNSPKHNEHMTILEPTNNIQSVFNGNKFYVNNLDATNVSTIELLAKNNISIQNENIESNLVTENLTANNANVKTVKLNGIDIIKQLDDLKCRLNKRKKRNVE